jgi:beta-1,4-mannosyltransferase
MGTRLKVFMLPTFQSFNRYCSALVQSIEVEGVDVRCKSEWTATLPLLWIFRSGSLPQVIHLHWIEIYTIKKTWWRSVVASTIFLLELLFLKALGVKIVWTVHDHVNVDGDFSTLDVVVRRLAAKLTNSVIVHTHVAREELTRLYRLSLADRTKIKVVPHGHFIDQYPNAVTRLDAREKLGLDNDLFVIGMIGYVRPYKGITDLIRAFSHLDGDRLRLVIAGLPMDSSFGEAVREAARIDNRIRLYLQFLPDEEIQFFLNAVDVVVFPFSRSLTSGSLILAMSFAKAVIAADLPTIREALPHEGGLLVDATDPSSLVRALTEIQTKDVALMGRNNFNCIRVRDWQSIAKATVGIYQEVSHRSAA